MGDGDGAWTFRARSHWLGQSGVVGQMGDEHGNGPIKGEKLLSHPPPTSGPGWRQWWPQDGVRPLCSDHDHRRGGV